MYLIVAKGKVIESFFYKQTSITIMKTYLKFGTIYLWKEKGILSYDPSTRLATGLGTLWLCQGSATGPYPDSHCCQPSVVVSSWSRIRISEGMRKQDSYWWALIIKQLCLYKPLLFIWILEWKKKSLVWLNYLYHALRW